MTHSAMHAFVEENSVSVSAASVWYCCLYELRGPCVVEIEPGASAAAPAAVVAAAK